MSPRTNHFIVRSAVAEQGAPTLAYAIALAAMMFILQGTAHEHKPIAIAGPAGPVGTFTPTTGFIYGSTTARKAA